MLIEANSLYLFLLYYKFKTEVQKFELCLPGSIRAGIVDTCGYVLAHLRYVDSYMSWSRRWCHVLSVDSCVCDLTSTITGLSGTSLLASLLSSAGLLFIVCHVRFVYRKRGKISRTVLLHWVRQLYWKCIQTVSDWVLSNWDHSNVIRCVCIHSILHIICCIIITWWCGPGGIEAWSGWPSSSFSAVTLLVGSFDTCY